MGVYHEPDELPEQLCGPAEADGVGRGHTAVGGRHLGGVLRAHLGKSLSTVARACSFEREKALKGAKQGCTVQSPGRGLIHFLMVFLHLVSMKCRCSVPQKCIYLMQVKDLVPTLCRCFILRHIFKIQKLWEL